MKGWGDQVEVRRGPEGFRHKLQQVTKYPPYTLGPSEMAGLKGSRALWRAHGDSSLSLHKVKTFYYHDEA